MGMVLQLLIPGVQDAEEADLRAQMTWVARHLQQCLGTGAKQQVEDHLLVLQRHWRQFARQGEYRRGRSEWAEVPARAPGASEAGVALAPRTMPIATRVI